MASKVTLKLNKVDYPHQVLSVHFVADKPVDPLNRAAGQPNQARLTLTLRGGEDTNKLLADFFNCDTTMPAELSFYNASSNVKIKDKHYGGCSIVHYEYEYDVNNKEPYLIRIVLVPQIVKGPESVDHTMHHVA